MKRHLTRFTLYGGDNGVQDFWETPPSHYERRLLMKNKHDVWYMAFVGNQLVLTGHTAKEVIQGLPDKILERWILSTEKVWQENPNGKDRPMVLRRSGKI